MTNLVITVMVTNAAAMRREHNKKRRVTAFLA
jgi:hypothetical protein